MTLLHELACLKADIFLIVHNDAHVGQTIDPRYMIPRSLRAEVDQFLIYLVYDLANVARGGIRMICSTLYMFSELNLYFTDPPQHTIPAGVVNL